MRGPPATPALPPAPPPAPLAQAHRATATSEARSESRGHPGVPGPPLGFGDALGRSERGKDFVCSLLVYLQRLKSGAASEGRSRRLWVGGCPRRTHLLPAALEF